MIYTNFREIDKAGRIVISKDIRMQDLILNILKLKKERKLESLLKK